MKSRFIAISVVLLAVATIVVLPAMRMRAKAASTTESVESTGEVSGTLVSANFDFDHADLSTPADVTTFTGSDSRFGKITGQYLGEFCT